MEASAQASQDAVQIRDAKDFRAKVDLFENRLLTLENAYAKAPVDLESIGIAQTAGYKLHAGWGAFAGHVVFFVFLFLRPNGLFARGGRHG